jgi:hypothetical protein
MEQFPDDAVAMSLRALMLGGTAPGAALRREGHDLYNKVQLSYFIRVK